MRRTVRRAAMISCARSRRFCGTPFPMRHWPACRRISSWPWCRQAMRRAALRRPCRKSMACSRGRTRTCTRAYATSRHRSACRSAWPASRRRRPVIPSRRSAAAPTASSQSISGRNWRFAPMSSPTSTRPSRTATSRSTTSQSCAR